ncbi:ABC transporter substrate-binding protein [Flavonifractor plautii]|uniref:ABC transporter substrate-binding protein n=1 Tax=Flavonifractor plautii TaxID=292800 RepID=UPI000B367BF8|nr:ABC transporter substrate-binding protein [Flavonifractor plautii]OUO83378.1 aliphatic sulfonate ABC transporter substrate-binding protein [Flavonifractor plautii]HJF01618.1 ABC transporter substrate-binding protein [Flavonifractor plautii]
MKKKLLSLALACGMVFSLAACGAPSNGETIAPNTESPAIGTETPAADTPTYELATVRVAYMPNLGSASSLFTAIHQGYFEEVGLTVEPAQFSGGPAEIAAMASGDIDISQIGHGAHSLCIQGEANVFAFDQLSQADAVVANKAKGIETAADLKGKTVAVSSGTSSEIILQFVLEEAGLTMDDIETIEMNVEGMTTALLSGQIDAAATWSPNTVTIEQALGDDYLVLGTNNDYTDQAAFPSSFICTPEYAEENHDILVRFSQAILKAEAYRAANIDEVAKTLAADLDAPEETMLLATGEGNWQGAVDCMGDFDTIRGYYEAQQQVFLNNGTVTEEVPVDNYVLFDVMEEAYTAYSAAQ